VVEFPYVSNKTSIGGGERREGYILSMQAKRQARKRNDVAATLAGEYLVD
jgi:hypothetical protein